MFIIIIAFFHFKFILMPIEIYGLRYELLFLKYISVELGLTNYIILNGANETF